MAMAPQSFLPSSPSMNNQISTTTSAIAGTPWHERERDETEFRPSSITRKMERDGRERAQLL